MHPMSQLATWEGIGVLTGGCMCVFNIGGCGDPVNSKNFVNFNSDASNLSSCNLQLCFCFQNVPNPTENHQYLQYSSPCWFRVLPVVSNYLAHTRNPPNSTWLIFNQSISLRSVAIPGPMVCSLLCTAVHGRKKQNPAEVDGGLFLL